MVQCNSYEKVATYVGRERPLLYGLREAFPKAISVDISVSFVMESGVRLLQKELQMLREKGVPVRFLVGEYMNITQPQALYLLKGLLGDGVDMRFFYDRSEEHFHPKAYFFHYEDGSDVFIGSSNISKAALTTGVEWNYKLSSLVNEEEYQEFYNEFLMLFEYNSRDIDEKALKEYARNWHAPKLMFKGKQEKEKEEDSKEEIELVGEEVKKAEVTPLIQPRGAQIEALYELNKTRMDGMNKALVVAATGIGKTYLAAFDCAIFHRVLFVAHRDEILEQAYRSFHTVYPEKKFGFFHAGQKDKDADVLFASVQTLGKKEFLNSEYSSKDAFDYIIVDEFHHAAANSYRKVLNYFKPKFLLGLTATPDRLDNKDIYQLCDYNLVYEADLYMAINRDWIVPFRYYGIYDETNYNEITFRNGKYEEEELEKALMLNKRVDLIVSHYRKYGSQRAIGFCCNIAHALFMAEQFNLQGISSMAVVSGPEGVNRKDAMEALIKGNVNVLFTVDLFNEGVDIPSLDLLLFLRPTESPTVFLQQLGRGLRKYPNKRYVNVLDFIGNYKKAFLVPSLLKSGCSENMGADGFHKNRFETLEESLPQDCRVDFDFRIVDLIERQRQQKIGIQAQLKEEFDRVSAVVKHRPNRVEFFMYMDDRIYETIHKIPKYNPFRGTGYLRFLKDIGELAEEEEKLLDTFAGEFLNMIEKTSMTKTYKLPVLLAFLKNNAISMTVTEQEIAASFRAFYSNPSNGLDLKRDKSTKDYLHWKDEQYIQLAKKNPIHFLLKTEHRFLNNKKGLICLDEKIEPYLQNLTFIAHFRDCVELRRLEFYKARLE